MRFAPSVLLAVLALLLATPVLAQDTGPEAEPAEAFVLEPPRSEAGREYVERVGRRVSTDARYLSADAPLDLTRSTLREGTRESTPQRSSDRSPLGSVLGWIVIGLVVAGIIFMLLQARFGDLFASAEKTKVKPKTVELADIGTADISGLSPDSLARMDDPREALRLLLIHALSRAADANAIALRRSFTARDVLARVPGTWGLRKLLEAIVRRGELVLFGGRPFDRDDLATVLEAAEPMFSTARGRRR